MLVPSNYCFKIIFKNLLNQITESPNCYPEFNKLLHEFTFPPSTCFPYVNDEYFLLKIFQFAKQQNYIILNSLFSQ